RAPLRPAPRPSGPALASGVLDALRGRPGHRPLRPGPARAGAGRAPRRLVAAGAVHRPTWARRGGRCRGFSVAATSARGLPRGRRLLLDHGDPADVTQGDGSRPGPEL